MTPLATIDQLQARLSVDISDVERAGVLLEDASATVRSYCGQDFTASTTTARLKVKRNVVRLPQRPVTDVDEVADTNGNTLTHEWVAGDRVKIQANLDDFSSVPWSSDISWVDVTYSHGYESVPDDIIAVVCQIAGRAFGTSPEAAALSSESLGSYAYSTGGAAASGAVGMLAGERAVLDRYRRQAGSITVTV